MRDESTTSGPVELVRESFEAVNRRDLDAILGFFAPGDHGGALSTMPEKQTRAAAERLAEERE